MPLHVTIKINRETLETLHIGRIKGGTHPNDLNSYLVVVGEEPLGLSEWESSGVEYKHRYGDGALVCVRKAIEALELTSGPEVTSAAVSNPGHICGFDFEIYKEISKCKCGALAYSPIYIKDKLYTLSEEEI
jgi:hypothetical protein